jgi:hypothetical protein
MSESNPLFNEYKEAVYLELLLTNELLIIEKKDLLNMTSGLRSLKIESFQKILANVRLEQLNVSDVFQLYLNRHSSFLNGKWSVSKQDNIIAEVISKNVDKCCWPTGCSYIGQLDNDHIIPRSSFSLNLKHLFDSYLNSTSLCPVHNRVIKRDNIMLGLWMRKFITLK